MLPYLKGVIDERQNELLPRLSVILWYPSVHRDRWSNGSITASEEEKY